jgi:phosphoribosylamine--glycine ligase
MAAEGNPFSGVLFAGIMISPAGEPILLEFNVRFGDPETEVLMDLLGGDLAETLAEIAKGRLDPNALTRRSLHAIAVVMAASGYPAPPRTGDVIEGLEAAAAVPGVAVLHAGTRLDPSGGRVLSAGGRVLVVTATGPTLTAARDRAYQGVAAIRFAGMQVRTDIGHQALD